MSNPTPKRLLVPVDLSEASRAGLRVASQIAARFDAEIIVLHVESATTGFGAVTKGDQDAQAAARRFENIARAAVEDFVEETLGKRPPIVLASSQDVPQTIVSVAEDRKCDWICMSAVGRTGWRQLVLGSTAAEVVRCASMPVLTLRGRTDEAVDFVFDDFRDVLVATDLAEGADRLVALGGELADPEGQLTILHVIEIPTDVGLYGVPLRLPVEDLDAAKEWTQGAIARLTEGLNAAVVASPRILTGRPAERILATEAELQPDLTIVGTHGRHGVEHLLLGSVAERVIRHATGPVLVMPTTGS